MILLEIRLLPLCHYSYQFGEHFCVSVPFVNKDNFCYIKKWNHIIVMSCNFAPFNIYISKVFPLDPLFLSVVAPCISRRT